LSSSGHAASIAANWHDEKKGRAEEEQRYATTARRGTHGFMRASHTEWPDLGTGIDIELD
jgi:hypothetical protein